MKKFCDAKGPMNAIKFKMRVKAEAQPEYQVFFDEIDKINTEHTKFVENLEYMIAVAENMDPVQDCFFCLLKKGVPTWSSWFVHILMHVHVHVYIFCI